MDSLPITLGNNVKKTVYSDENKKHNAYYNWAWGKHYRDLYYKPITTKAVSSKSLFGGLSEVDQLSSLHAIILKNNNNNYYILKPLGGSSSFLESKFFSDIYKKEDFKDTYLGDFINEAYTIIHPYMFLVSEKLAGSVDICSSNPHIFYMEKGSQNDTIADGSHITDKLVSISALPKVEREKVVTEVTALLDSLHRNSYTRVDQQEYIKSRLFDMLIGDWNKVSENWYWFPSYEGDSVIYSPQTFDRSHAFTKVDGKLFKEMLNMLGVGFITNYESKIKNLKKFNTLAYPLDIALTQESDKSVWLKQAKELKSQLSDDAIESAFSKLPAEMQDSDSKEIKKNLKLRRDNLEKTASDYYDLLQSTPVITGTKEDDRFVINQTGNSELEISVYDKESGLLVLNKKYNKKNTKEIWIYGIGGNDTFDVNKEKRGIPVLLIGGKGTNEYNVEKGKSVSIYEYESEKERLKSVSSARVIIPNDETALDYDYQQLRHTKLTVTPIGIYDSDLGLNLGTTVAYTVYGFRRAPFTRRHQISYDYTSGITYQGIFPTYDERKSLHVAAFLGSPAYFSNFFGFGNNTNGYKDEKKNYNRVNIRKYMVTPAIYYDINKDQTFNIFGSFEVYKVKNPDDRDRFINTIYTDNSSIFSSKYYFNLGATYEMKKKMSGFVSSIDLSVTSGWNVNIDDAEYNFAYAKADFGINLKLTDRLTFATLLKGKALFSDKYEFYQAATTELRGFRSNRFIGQQSFYQYSDIRLDMGRLNNPFTPLHYGIFAGIDHGRVWYPDESSDNWHSSYGGGFWLTLFRKFTGKFSYFGSNDGSRFSFELGMGF